ncbi:MAG: hypothetical protein AABZ02_13285 [Bacteroidota bacterium]
MSSEYIRHHGERSWRTGRSSAHFLVGAARYRLTADEFAHILTTFPVFARKHPVFFAYLLARLKEWKEEG